MIDSGIEYRKFSERELSGINPLYAAWVRAHAMRVPQGHTYFFTFWLRDQRDTFFVEKFGSRIWRETGKVDGLYADLRYMNLVLDTEVEFKEWLQNRFPPKRQTGARRARRQRH